MQQALGEEQLVQRHRETPEQLLSSLAARLRLQELCEIQVRIGQAVKNVEHEPLASHLPRIPKRFHEQ
jgi:hypothetical protein